MSKEATKKWRARNKDKVRAYRIKWKKENSEKDKESSKKWRKNHPDYNKYSREYQRKRYGYIPREEYLKKVIKRAEDLSTEWAVRIYGSKKEASRYMLRRAVRTKHIIKPDRCQRCNKLAIKRNLHGHHTNYDKWWDVEWLCQKCHMTEHGRISNDS